MRDVDQVPSSATSETQNPRSDDRTQVSRRPPATPVVYVCRKTGKQSMEYLLAQARARNRRRKHHERVSAYHCRWCHLWHIGHRPRSKRSR